MTIIFESKEHEMFFYKYLSKCKCQDIYHRALLYCLGINRDTRDHISSIYSITDDAIKKGCLNEGWITSGSAKVIRMAFNLYNGGTPSVYEYENPDEQVIECRKYTVDKLFSCGYAPYFYEAIKIRYPEYI